MFINLINLELYLSGMDLYEFLTEKERKIVIECIRTKEGRLRRDLDWNLIDQEFRRQGLKEARIRKVIEALRTEFRYT